MLADSRKRDDEYPFGLRFVCATLRSARDDFEYSFGRLHKPVMEGIGKMG